MSSGQIRWYYKANDGVIPRRESRRTLSKTRRELASPSPQKSGNVLLPPFVSPGELRVLLGIDYKSALALCQVKLYQQKYFWTDLEGRWFETSNKRKVLVPFSAVAPSVKLFGINPVLVDPEPIVPVVADSDRLRTITVVGGCERVPYGKSFDKEVTILPRPVSEIMTGRLVSRSDGVVVIGSSSSLEFAALEFASRANIPVIRLESSEDFDMSRILEQLPKPTPVESSAEIHFVDPLAIKHRSEKKRTDILVDADRAPTTSAVVLDVTKTVETGHSGTVLVQRGVLRLGQHFVAGSGYGKITNIWSLCGDKLSEACPGMVVKVGRLAKDTGDFAPDDYLHVFPRERAWRIAFHRERIEWLNSFQTEGKKLPSGFEMDGMMNSRNFAEFVDEFSVRAEQVVVNKNYFVSEERERLEALIDREQSSILVMPARDVVGRWARRMQVRKQERERTRELAELERTSLMKIRDIVQEKPACEEKEAGLPESLPVFALIVKTQSVSEFDALLDQLETLETCFRVKLPVVHGGIGPVTPNDLVHAEIESKYSPCPVYAVNVGLVPEAKSAESNVLELPCVEDVVDRVRSRILRFRSMNARNHYRSQLSREHSL